MIKTYYEITQIKNVSLTFGFFDGIHLGHKKVISSLVNSAKMTDTKSVVIVFDKNNEYYFGDGNSESILSIKDLQIILEGLGVDYIIELNFEKYKNLSAQEFLEDVIINNFAPVSIVTGRNYTFGKDLEGNYTLLKENQEKYKYSYIDILEETNNGEIISSKVVKELITNSEISDIKPILGRNFSLYNSVIKGDRKSSVFCVPTANVIWPESIVKMPHGVYLGYCQVDNKIHSALISWGDRPTLSDGSDNFLEVHIIDYKNDLYGKLVKITFIKKLRDIEKFDSAELLKQQIFEDCFACKKWSKIGN